MKELAVCGLLLASRKVVDGAAWVRTQAGMGADVEQAVEKGKSQFVGPELMGKTLGVVGLGAIGVQVANIATKLGMTVYGYDPFLSVDAALLPRPGWSTVRWIWRPSIKLRLHHRPRPLTPDTQGMICTDSIQMMKGGVRILNLARGGLVNDDDMLRRSGERQGGGLRHRLPQQQDCPGQERGGHSPSGRLQPRERGKLRRHGGAAAPGLSGERKHQKQRQPPHSGAGWSGIARLCIIHRNIPGTIAGITKVLSRRTSMWRT